MTEPAQVRLKIDPELHTEFKAQCARTGISMADQTARMIAQYLDTNRIPDEQPKSVAVDAEDNPEDCARLSHPVGHSVDQALADHRDILLGVSHTAQRCVDGVLAHRPARGVERGEEVFSYPIVGRCPELFEQLQNLTR